MLNQDHNNEIVSIGIVGAGKVGFQLFQLFSQSLLARIVFVVDRDLKAPAMLAARDKKVLTYTDINQALKLNRVAFIFEVTGSAKVAEMINSAILGSSTQLVTHDMAFILMRVIEENRLRTMALVRQEIEEIKAGIIASLSASASTMENIKDTTTDLRYLALNARIETARAGEQGRGFEIVAQQVEQSAQTVRDRTHEIDQLNTNISAIIDRIDVSLQKLV